MAEQRTPAPKLAYLLNSLIQSTSRQQQGLIKNQIKSSLQAGPDANQTNSALMIEQLLAFSIHSQRICSLVLNLDDKTPYLSAYSSQFVLIGKKYLQSKQNTKLDQNKKQVKLIKTLIASKIIEDHSYFEKALEEAKQDQIYCGKFMSMMADLFMNRKISFDCTQLVILTFNLLKVRAVASLSLTINALKIMHSLLINIEGLRSTIFVQINEILIKMIGQNAEYQQACLQIINSNMKHSQNQQATLMLISQVLKELSTFYGEKLEKFTRKQKKEGQEEHQQVLLQQKNPKSNVPKQISQQLCLFLLFCHSKLGSVSKSQTHSNSTSMISSNQLKQEMIKKIQQFVIHILLFVDCSQVGKLNPILEGTKQLERRYLCQCLINCYQYSTKSSKQQMWQQQILMKTLSWLQNQPIAQLNKIKQLICVPVSQIQEQQQKGQQILMDYIKKTIQNQFQFQFNQESMKSVCNLFCYLLNVFNVNYQQQKIKDYALQMVKMLLNLNQSCEKEYRALMVQLVIKIITVYAKVLLKDNQFLMEVIVDKLTEGNLFQYRQQLIYLAQNKLIGSYFCDKIIKNLQKGIYLNCQQKQLQLIFELLFMAEKQKMQEITNAINNGDNSILSWEWAAYIHVAGKKIYANNWPVMQKQLKPIRQKMMQYPLQFQNDVAKMESIFRTK